MKKLILPTLFISSVYGTISPQAAPESPGIQQQKLNEIDKKAIATKKSAVIEKLKVSKEAEGQGENRIKGATFVLQNVSVVGNTVLDKNEIITVIKKYVGKGVDSIDLKNIAEEITNIYKNKGFVTSKCIIPAQKVQNGNVKFQIIEDKLGRIILSGKTTYNYDSNLFMRYLADLQGKIINANELNDRLKILSNLPVTSIKPSLQKTNNGYTNLVLDITESEQRFSISTDNSGSQYTGKNRITLNGNINNIRGKSDSLALSLTTVENTEQLSSFAINYLHPVGKEGGKINFSYSKMNYLMIVQGDETSNAFASNNAKNPVLYYSGTSNTYGLNYYKPLNTNFDNTNISYNFGVENKTITTGDVRATYDANSTSHNDIIGDAKDDKTFVATAGISFGKLDSLFSDKHKGHNNFSFSIKKGIEGLFDSSKKQDILIYQKQSIKTKSNMDFLKFHYTLQRQQQLPYKTTMNLNLNGTYTKDRVPDSYEYSGGDYGYAYSLSLARKFWYINTSLSASQSKVFTYATDMSKSSVENTPSLGLALSTSYEDIYLSLSYSSSFDTWDSNTNNIRYSLRYSW